MLAHLGTFWAIVGVFYHCWKHLQKLFLHRKTTAQKILNNTKYYVDFVDSRFENEDCAHNKKHSKVSRVITWKF